MEAYNGGNIGAVRDGDIIDIDIPGRALNVRLEDQQIKARLKTTAVPERALTPLLRAWRQKFCGVNCYGV